MKKAVVILMALLAFVSNVFSEELTARELVNFVKEKYPFMPKNMAKRAEEVSLDVVGIDKNSLRSEWALADARYIKRVMNIGGIAASGYLIIPIFILPATTPKTQKLMLKREMLHHRLLTSMKQVCID